MDYKEKYNEALERAKAAYGTGAYDDATLEFLFPQLCESEEETTRKELLDFVRSFWADHKDKLPQARRWVTYLEKQKEPSTNSEIPKESKPVQNPKKGCPTYPLSVVGDSLAEQKPKPEWTEADLEKEIDKVWNNGLSDELAGPHNNFNICANLARHFYKLGKEDKK